MCFPSHNAVHQLHQTSLQKTVQLDSRRSTGSTGRGWEAVPTRLLLKKVAAGKPFSYGGYNFLSQGRGWDRVAAGKPLRGLAVINRVAAGKPLRVSGL